MSIVVDLPQRVIELLEPDREREVLEGTLLKLVSEGRVTLALAGELLGKDRAAAIQWYTGHGLPYPNLGREDLADELDYASGS
jgi:hypothetical protein